MESGSAVVGNEARKKYHIYVEEYVLSYLRRESDSLELSEIYFYGSRQENGRTLYVYGAGRTKGIAAFAGYEPLPELVCRLTQAGPVFLVREQDGECRASGFQVFYDNNEAMQNYLLEWTGSTGKGRAAEKDVRREILPVSVSFPEEKKRTPHRAMSVQLCLILVVLVAIVITSTDSYDKMEELNRSAREVFFAIENQEAGETIADTGDREIVVERNTRTSRETEQGSGTTEESAQYTDTDAVSDIWEKDTGSDETPSDQEHDAGPDEVSDTREEDAVSDEASDTWAQDGTGSSTEDLAGNGQQEEGVLKSAQRSSDAEEGQEALSRSITRYYEVEQGDTLYTICQKIYGDISRVEEICEVNDISDPDKIRFGQRIILP